MALAVRHLVRNAGHSAHANVRTASTVHWTLAVIIHLPAHSATVVQATWPTWHGTAAVLRAHVPVVHGRRLLLLVRRLRRLLGLLHGVSIALRLVPCPLTGVVELNGPSEDLLALHFLDSAFALLFDLKLDEAVAFRHSGHWVANDLGLVHGRVNLLEGLQKHWIGDAVVKVTDVDLEVSMRLH